MGQILGRLLIWHLMALELCAAVGGTAVLPVPGNATQRSSRLRLELSSYWVESGGYRPLRVTVSSLTPARADRNLTVRVLPHSWDRARQGIEFDLRLPQGATSVSRELPTPQNGVWNQFEVVTFEDGRKLDDLSATVGIARSVSSWSWTEAYPALLFIDADAPPPNQVASMINAALSGTPTTTLPDILALGRMVAPLDDFATKLSRGDPLSADAPNRTRRSNDHEILSAVQMLQNVALLSPTELPNQWLNYTCIDLIFVSLSDLQRMSEQQPETWGAIRDHLLAGGNLIVYGVRADFAGLEPLDRVLALPSAGTAAPAAAGTAWQMPRTTTFGVDLSSLITPDGTVRSYDGRVIVEELVDEDEGDGTEERRPKDPPPESQFRWRRFGWGTVIAMSPDEVGAIDDGQWSWALNEIGPDRWRWYRRHGLSTQRPNKDFWNFLVPGVGAAPVRTFLAVITAFVIVIGPINYFLLNRSRRLYLLLVTVPLGAALIIASLFGFALLKDGLGTRARLRSFSRVLPDGRLLSWSRQSYYAGVAPSSGLIYPLDAAVLPIDYDPDRRQRGLRLTQWREQQQLRPGYLSPRSTAQQLVIHATPSAALFELTRSGTDPPHVSNRSATDVAGMLVQDQGEMFWVDALAAGASQAAELLSPEDARKRYQQLFNEQLPAIPLGFTAPSETTSIYYYNNNFDTGFGAAEMATSLLEHELVHAADFLDPSRRVYYAVMRQTPEHLPVAVPDSRQEAGFHVVHGEW